jgi:hypothetical protein
MFICKGDDLENFGFVVENIIYARLFQLFHYL